MLNIFLFIVCLTVSPQRTFSDFSVDVELLQITSNEEVKLKVTVEKLSDNAVNVFKYRRQDYKREKSKVLGNYVIEIQKFETNQYTLFTPSADIGPVFENQEHISLQKGDNIADTLYIDGFSFSRSSESKRGFPQGKYRLRIYFNSNMAHCNEANGSNWIEFKIE